MKNKQKLMQSMITGMSGGALLMISDWFMESLSSDNVSNGIVQSSWTKAATWRYEAGMLICCVAVFLLFFGMRDMIRLMKMTASRKDPWSLRAVQAFELGGISLVVGELFLHAKGCILPIMYKKLYATSLMGADMLTIVEDVFFYMAIPFYVLMIMKIVCTSIPYMYQIWQRRLKLPIYFIALNPLVLWLLGWLLRLFNVTLISNFTRGFASFGVVLLFYGFLQHVMQMSEEAGE